MPISPGVNVPVRQEITAETLRNLYNNCPALRMIGREWEKYFEEKTPIGTTLNIVRPWKPRGRNGQAFQPEPIVQTTVPLTISYWRGVDWIYNDVDEALYLNMARYHENYSRPAGLLLANLIESDLLQYMQVTAPNYVGTPGTNPTTNQLYNSAQTMLNQMLAPQEGRAFVYNSQFNQNLVGLNSTLFNDQREISDEFLEGYVGKYAGFKFTIDEQLPSFTVGTYGGTGQVDGANQTGTSILTKSWTSGSLGINPGDRLEFAGVNKVNPNGGRITYSNTPFQVVVTSAVTDTAGAATINFYPALIPAGQFQNCSGSPADGAQITIAGNSGQTCTTAFFFQKEAYTSAFLKLHKPSNVDAEVMGGEEAGTQGVYIRSLKQWNNSGPYAGYETERMDVIYGFAAQYADYMAGVLYGA